MWRKKWRKLFRCVWSLVKDFLRRCGWVWGIWTHDLSACFAWLVIQHCFWTYSWGIVCRWIGTRSLKNTDTTMSFHQNWSGLSNRYCDTWAHSHLTHPQVAQIQHIFNPRWHMTALSLMQLPQMSLTATHTFSQCILNVKPQRHSTVRLWRAQTRKRFGI